MKIPERYKDRSDYSVDERLQLQQARRRGQPDPKFETPEYQAHRIATLRAGSLAEEADELERAGSTTPPTEMSTHEHFERIRRSQ